MTLNSDAGTAVRSIRIRFGPWAADGRGRTVFQTIELYHAACSDLTDEAVPTRVVERSSFIENASELTAGQLDRAVSEMWQRRADALPSGALILPGEACPTCAAQIP